MLKRIFLFELRFTIISLTFAVGCVSPHTSPPADTVTTVPVAGLCDRIENRTFVSVKKLFSKNSSAMTSAVHRRLTFRDRRVQWQDSDRIEMIPYTCEDGKIVAGQWVGKIRDHGALISWQDDEYTVVP